MMLASLSNEFNEYIYSTGEYNDDDDLSGDLEAGIANYGVLLSSVVPSVLSYFDPAEDFGFDSARLRYRSLFGGVEIEYRRISEDFRSMIIARSEDIQATGSLFDEGIAQNNLFSDPPEFRVSDELVRFLVASHVQLRTSVGLPIKDTLSVGGSTEFVGEFSKKIRQQFVLFAQELKYTSVSRMRISTKGSFDAQVQIRLCDAFFIVPDKSNTFLSYLHRDIVKFLMAGGSLAGQWGSYSIVADGDLQLNLSMSKDDPREKFVRAKRLE
jgi:hypothetical protein